MGRLKGYARHLHTQSTLVSFVLGRTDGRKYKGWVYFVQDERGPFKVGVSHLPGLRVEQLQGSNPFEVKLEAMVEGSKDFEKACHEMFADSHIRGEWFKQERVENYLFKIWQNTQNPPERVKRGPLWEVRFSERLIQRFKQKEENTMTKQRWDTSQVYSRL